MKRLISVILAAALLFSVAMAEKKERSPEYEIVSNNLFSLTDEELKDIKELVDALVANNELKEKIEKEEQQKTKEEQLGIWVEKYFVDSFNEPTKDKYISTKLMIKGTFNNSAATDKELKVKLLISLADDKETPIVGIELYEYGDNRVNNSSGTNIANYSLYVRKEDGGTKYFSCYIPKKASRIYIDEEYANFGFGTRKDFVEILKTNKTVKFRMTNDSNYTNSSYAFQIDDTTGFDYAYQWLLSDEE